MKITGKVRKSHQRRIKRKSLRNNVDRHHHQVKVEMKRDLKVIMKIDIRSKVAKIIERTVVDQEISKGAEIPEMKEMH